MKPIFARGLGLSLLAAAVLPGSSPAQITADTPILIEQRIIAINLNPEYADGISWDLLQLYLDNQSSTTGYFPLSDRAHRRLDFKPMRKRTEAGKEKNTDFEIVEQTRLSEFNYGPIWEDARNPKTLKGDLAFGSLRIENFKPMMDYLRNMGDATVLFHRKWVTSNGAQSVVSSQPELAAAAAPGRPGMPVPSPEWDGSRLTIKPEILENNQIAFHIVSEIATTFYADPARYPGNPVSESDGIRRAKVWRLFRLNTKAVVESGQTAVFEDFREGQGIIILTTPSILEAHRKVLRD